MRLLPALLASAALIAAPAPAAPLFGRKQPKVSDYAPTLAPPPVAAPAPANGAIFQAAYGYAPLTSGARAAMVGDVLTITLIERTQASKTNSATTSRDGAIEISPPTTGFLSALKKTDVSVASNDGFSGKGAAAQSNTLSGQISVTIAQVYPNGTMLVRGEKLLTLNKGDERIQVSGIVRAVDIGADNTVPSYRVADARITYNGKGEIARASQQGWLGRFFSRISPL